MGKCAACLPMVPTPVVHVHVCICNANTSSSAVQYYIYYTFQSHKYFGLQIAIAEFTISNFKTTYMEKKYPYDCFVVSSFSNHG